MKKETGNNRQITSANVEEVNALFENAQAAQIPYFKSIIQLVERLELKIKLLEEQLVKKEMKE